MTRLSCVLFGHDLREVARYVTGGDVLIVLRRCRRCHSSLTRCTRIEASDG